MRKNLKAELGLNYSIRWFEVKIAEFNNRFNNYI